MRPGQWGLVVVVFLLTLSALYGLGMALASLFLLWGREAVVAWIGHFPA